MTAIRWEQIKQHLIDYAQKFEKVVVFSIEDFAKTYGYNVEDLLNYIEEISDEEHDELLSWHETLLKSGKPIINLELEQYKVFDKLLNRTEKIYSQDDLKELKKKYSELSDKLERIETSSNRHTVKLIIETYLTVEYSNETFNLMLKEIHKILDIERTGDTTYENEHIAKTVDYLIQSNLNFEIRTTIHSDLLDVEDINIIVTREGCISISAGRIWKKVRRKYLTAKPRAIFLVSPSAVWETRMTTDMTIF